MSWKDIPEFKGLYQASNTGQIRRIGASPWAVVGHVLTPCLGSQRVPYLHVYLMKDHKRYSRTVHGLVAAAFLGPRLGRQVNHKDHDRKNNALTNLEYVTPQGNIDHARYMGRLKCGEQLPHSKLTEAQVREIRASKLSSSKLEAHYSVTARTIRRARSGELWRHV